jgi:hypothetical protein
MPLCSNTPEHLPVFSFSCFIYIISVTFWICHTRRKPIIEEETKSAGIFSVHYIAILIVRAKLLHNSAHSENTYCSCYHVL